MKNRIFQAFLSAGLVLSMLSFANCGGDSEEDDPNPDMELLDPTLVASPCIDSEAGLTLPASASSSQNEIGLEIYSVVTAGNALIPTFATFYFPPTDAERLPPDGIYVDEGDVAYLWGIEGDNYIYLKKNLDYSVYEADDNNRFGQEILFVEQDENCEKFNLTQYAGSDDPQQGKPVFYFFYRNSNATLRMEYGEGSAVADGLSYLIRIFPDNTGEFTKYMGGNKVLSATWSASGSGGYTRYEDGSETESGNWSF